MTALIRDLSVLEGPAQALAPLVTRLQATLRAQPSGIAAAEGAADCLQGCLPTPDVLSAEDRLGDPDAYQQHILFVDRLVPFSIVALVWREGQQTTIHDHRCWGAVAVVQGAEHETLYTLRNQPLPHLLPGRQTSYPAGDVSAFAPPGDIHQVRNGGPGTAISIHVYGADIAQHGSSIRRSYPPNLVAA